MAPTYGSRLLRLPSTTGMRIGELFSLTEHHLDLSGRSLFVPAELCKERRDKTIPLFADEVALLREQLLARAPGTALVFPTKTGRPWRYGQFHKLIWSKARQRAELVWAGEHPGEPNPFVGLTAHSLRSTAADLMRNAGLAPELAAARLGHADGGALLLSNYRNVEAQALREEMDRIGSLRAALEGDADESPPTSSRPSTATPPRSLHAGS